MTCFHCSEKGHYAREWKMKEKGQLHAYVADISGDESNEVEHNFHQNNTMFLGSNWLLLDNQSTVD